MKFKAQIEQFNKVHEEGVKETIDLEKEDELHKNQNKTKK